MAISKQSYGDLMETEEDAGEVTPLLLAARLHDLLRAPRDAGKRVRLELWLTDYCARILALDARFM